MLFAPLLLILASCSSQQMLEVKSYQLRDIEVVDREARMVRAEQHKRLYGAISKADRQLRLGGYYSASWNVKDSGLEGPVKLVFHYRQAGTASEVHRKELIDTSGEPKGSVEFRVIGKEYANQGRVLAWRTELYQAGKLLDSQQSYMWE